MPLRPLPIRRMRPALAAAVAAGLASGQAARAADLSAASPAPTFTQVDPSLWVVTLTANVQATPSYPGSETYTAIGYPSLAIRRAGTPVRFTAPDDGVSLSLFDGPNFQFGPTARYVSGRYYGDDRRHLFGLRDARFAIEPGLFLEYYPVAWLRTRVELRHGVYGHHGFVGTIGADVIQPFGRWQVSLGPRFNFGDESYARKYFGVSPIEAAVNGRLTAFSPDSFVTVGALGALTYTFDERWAATGYIGYNRIVGASADSPLVRRDFGSPNQYTFGMKVNYSFTMPALF